ncbi:MAG: sulfate transporter [Robiginitomaculum sp.]|nr:MAG: sulfate transporter [Robiginitomaculum sp.]
MNIESSDTNPAQTIPAGYLMDAKGRLVPESLIKDHQRLEDDLVRKIMGHAVDLSDQIARFHAHTFSDMATFMDLLEEKYGMTKGGKKGNVTFSSFDGCMRVQINIQDHLEFGPELQIAKGLIDECIADWSSEMSDKIMALVNHAFNVDKAGQVNREALFSLRRLDIDDPKWRAAVAAINDSIRTIGSKAYIRFYRRINVQDKWVAVTIDLAKVGGR